MLELTFATIRRGLSWLVILSIFIFQLHRRSHFNYGMYTLFDWFDTECRRNPREFIRNFTTYVCVISLHRIMLFNTFARETGTRVDYHKLNVFVLLGIKKRKSSISPYVIQIRTFGGFSKFFSMLINNCYLLQTVRQYSFGRRQYI